MEQTVSLDTETLKTLGVVFTGLKFKNFMSFGNLWTEIDLEKSGTTLLVGENLDNGGSSGAGKSTLINAISFGLYDKIPSGVTKDRLINRTNEKKNTLMEVQLTFTVNGEEYTLRRWRGASTGVQLLKDDLDITPASVNRGEDSFNAKVEELVGFSYNLFSQIILFNGNSKPFLDLSVGAQRDLIEELFKITILTRKANALKKMTSETDKAISLQKVLIQQQQKQAETRAKHLTDAADRVEKWDIAHTQLLGKLQAQLEAALSIDFDTEEKIHGELGSLRQCLTDAQNTVKNVTLQKSTREREKSPTAAQLTISQNDLVKRKSDLTKVAGELQHLRDAKCPYCLQKFEDAAAKIGEMETKQTSLENEISLLESKVNDLQVENNAWIEQQASDVESLTTQLDDAKQAESEAKTQLDSIISTLTFPDLNSLLTAKASLSTLQGKLEEALVEMNPHVDALETLKLEDDVKVDDDALNELEKLLEHQKFLAKLLTDKNSFIRKNIISKTIPFLNKRIAYYTEKLNLPHIVLFQADMSCEITQIGRELDHGNLSNGEKKKLNLSLCLAFRDVLTYLHSKVNVLFTDEVDSGSISGIDLESLIKLLHEKTAEDQIGIFIISHRHEFEGRCNHNIVITKENGFSTVTQVY